MFDNYSDTVAALSTPPGKAALGLIRVSGPETFKVLEKIFKYEGKRPFPRSFSSFFGYIVEFETGKKLDQVILFTYEAPNSYTGEDMAEISLHGNPTIIASVLSELFNHGVRQAEAGEFTKRAFLNGKMDLLEVEALSQLLNAPTKAQASMALNQLEGLPSALINKLREKLVEQLVQLDASLNFPEEDIESLDEKLLAHALSETLDELQLFKRNSQNGSLVSGGLSIVLAGAPNSGKSSLLNALLNKERAIVTDIPGTTRDLIEENFQIRNIPVRLTDTAGIRKTENLVESIGVDRAKAGIENAFMILALFDSSEPFSAEDSDLMNLLESFNKPFLCLLTKSDLPFKIGEEPFKNHKTIKISSQTGHGLLELKDTLYDFLKEKGLSELENMIVLGAKQTASLNKAVYLLERLLESMAKGIYQDMISIDLEEIVRELGKITGQTVDFNSLDLIFERFCIGK
ncbi:MAG: tRNA uridine-5-carboxymethylaminomethyl(34) synthesis GTPase MnmE [Candidatus Riflebacteria bacterium]|nr:tRNA uridine-5-carboxymethylaminomethyl(34) synthesis GTPase MnmE [Candidatus Riflebacteria bacterium]